MSAEPFAFTVRGLAAGLGTEPWRLTRIIGVPGGLPAVKSRGAGRMGRGGQWRISADALLTYVGVPAEDWPPSLHEPEPVLDRITLLSRIAQQENTPLPWARNVWQRTVQQGVPYGRSDALLPSHVIDKTRQALRQERSPA